MTPPPLADPRKPKCSRCRHHGIVIPKKGHGRRCPFQSCECWKCGLITQRTRLSTVQRSLTRVPNTGTTERGPGPGASSAGTPAGGAGPGDTCGGAPVVWIPVDPRSRRPDPGGAPGAGLESRDAPPGASNPRRLGEVGPAFPPPHFPAQMLGNFPGSFSPPPHLLLHLPYLPPVPVGLYDGLCGPLMLPPVQQGALQYLPPSETPSPATGLPHPSASSSSSGESFRQSCSD